tara:strand:+ start:708 stop:1019 length:312 start_codon:yes stop_codon:yes gene_type:complete
MMPSIRSLTELRVIAQSRNEKNNDHQKSDLSEITEDSGQRKRYLRTNNVKRIDLPKITKVEWRKRKDKVYKFLDGLAYQNEIKSLYNLNLREKQSMRSQEDAA